MSPENEWDATAEPYRLLDLLRDRLTFRLAWRIAVGYCRVHQDRITAPGALAALDLLEAVADGSAAPSRLNNLTFPDTRDRPGGYDLVHAAVLRGYLRESVQVASAPPVHLREQLRGLDLQVAVARASAAAGPAPQTAVPPDHPWHRAFQKAYYEYVQVKAEVIRCVVGNPFRRPAFDADWRTSTVLALVEGVRSDRAFDRLPILADALEDAGCDNPHVLDHCRHDRHHVRGCWVVDLVLGKA